MKNFNRSIFFPIKKKLSIESINELLADIILSNTINKNFDINNISSLSNIRNNSIIFVDKEIKIEEYNDKLIHIISSNIKNKNYYKSITVVNNLNTAYNTILNNMFYHEDQIGYQDDFNFINGSYISKFSDVDKSCFIGKNCVISRGVKIGSNSIVKNNVVIKNSLVGKNVVICDNTSIGTSGFGFDFKMRGSKHFNPQIGIVTIDDNVHIGSSCTVDRGKIDDTFIGKNSMIDNMVHIAHNVRIGKNACIAAQTGIAGSVIIGDNVTIGGQVGFAGHIKIGENVVIAARSGVTKNINDNSVVAGFPAVDIKVWKKNLIKQRKNGY